MIKDLLDKLSFGNTNVGKLWHYMFVINADRRTSDWILMDNPVPAICIIIAYVYFVTSLGPKLMAKREPFKMKNLLIVYNFLQVVICIFLIYEGTFNAYFFGGYSFRCQPVDRTRSRKATRMAKVFYFYFLTKLLELFDTIFFVLRKKQNQISFLHVYHHSGMALICWGVTKYYPGGHAVFIGFINAIVHLVMYSYYMFSAMGPKWQKYLWWKKYITSLQMFQFIACFLHFAQLLWTDCGFPRWVIFFVLPNAIFLYFLFNDFYQKSYKAGQGKKEAERLKESERQRENDNHYKNDFLNDNCNTTPNLMLQSNQLHSNVKKIE